MLFVFKRTFNVTNWIIRVNCPACKCSPWILTFHEPVIRVLQKLDKVNITFLIFFFKIAPYFHRPFFSRKTLTLTINRQPYMRFICSDKLSVFERSRYIYWSQSQCYSLGCIIRETIFPFSFHRKSQQFFIVWIFNLKVFLNNRRCPFVSIENKFVYRSVSLWFYDWMSVIKNKLNIIK